MRASTTLSHSPDAHGRFALVAVDRYDQLELELPRLGEQAARIAALLSDLGFEQDPFRPPKELSDQLLRRWLSDWQPAAGRLVLYWTGHAEPDHDEIWLWCANSRRSEPFTAISGRHLGQILARREATDIVVIIDTCTSGIGVDEVTAAFKKTANKLRYPVGREPGLAVFSSARPDEVAYEGVFAEALEKVLREGPPPPTEYYTPWTAQDRLITPTELYDALRVHLANTGARQSPDFSQVRSVNGFFPFFANQGYRSNLQDLPVETRRRSAFVRTDLLEHFMMKFRGIDTFAAAGWYFSPRPEPQQSIAEWLNKKEGMLVLTGPPGSGKSALLGWLAALSMPEYRDHVMNSAPAMGSASDLAPLPPAGAIDAGIHAKQKTLLDCMKQLGDALDLTPPTNGWQEPAELVDMISDLARRHQRRVTILLDALDEAYPADQRRIAAQLLAPLADQPRVRVIVGTRPNRQDPQAPCDPSPHHDSAAPPGDEQTTAPGASWRTEGPLIRALTRDADRVVRLDTDPGAHDAITRYVRNRLLDATTSSPYLTDPLLAQAIAEAVADHSDGVFLFARLLTRTLINRPAPLALGSPQAAALFTGGVTEAFEEDLKNYGENRQRVYGLLAPLAWAEGAGLPRRQVWLALANALAPPGVTYTEHDIAWVLEHAGAHIIESGEDGQTVYRLYHQAFNDYFQRQVDHRTVQHLITQALLALADPK